MYPDLAMSIKLARKEGEMRIPMLHLNGTGKEMLTKGYEDAWHALREAQKALRKIEFNARDYYVQGPDAWTEAVREMDARFDAIGRVEKEIEEILIAIN